MRHHEHQISTSVLVIGTGGSELRAAIELAERGVDVLAVGKRPKLDAHTSLAAGGINMPHCLTDLMARSAYRTLERARDVHAAHLS
jgi:succinate dehydrogenase/fumarate reductase flavoprotein subunit